MSKGSPKLAVRVPATDQQRYREAAEAAGLDFSTWVRAALDAATTKGSPQ